MSEVLRDFPEVSTPMECINIDCKLRLGSYYGMFDSSFVLDLNLPLKKQEETWGNSYLAVACGNITGNKTKDRKLLAPVTIPDLRATVSCYKKKKKKCMVFFSFYLFQAVIIFTCVRMDLNSRKGLNP